MKPPRYRLPAYKAPGAPPRPSGRSKQQSGAAFQRDIAASNAWYADRGLALVDDIPVATVFRKGNLQFAGKRGRVDYMGLVVTPSGGTPIAFDAKVTSGRTLSLAHWDDPKHRQRVALQVGFLTQWVRMGGLGGYLCFHRDDDRLYWLGVDALAPLTHPAVIAGAKPDILVREKSRSGPIVSPHPHCALPALADLARNLAPPIPYRDLVLPSRN